MLLFLLNLLQRRRSIHN